MERWEKRSIISKILEERMSGGDDETSSQLDMATTPDLAPAKVIVASPRKGHSPIAMESSGRNNAEGSVHPSSKAVVELLRKAV